MAPDSSSGSSSASEARERSSEGGGPRPDVSASASRSDGRFRPDRSREELERSLDATREEILRRVESLRRELALPGLDLRERVGEHPEAAVLAAAAAGILVGRLLRGSGREGSNGDAHRRLLARALFEARSRAESGSLDEEAIAEIAETYGAALDRAAGRTDRGGGLVGGLLAEVGPALVRRLAKEGIDRVLPRLLALAQPPPPEEGA